MKIQQMVSLVGVLALFASDLIAAPLGTAFTYQGKLSSGSNPANGIYDLTFTLYDAAGGGSAVAGPLTNGAVAVSNGLFTVTLDFGNAFDGNSRWLEIGVRTNGSGAFTTLTPRQPVTATPYAAYAPSAGAAATATTAASANSVAAANVSGTLALGQLPGAVVTNNATGVTLAGTFIGSGVGLASVNADQVDGQHGTFYQNAANLTSGTLADARLSANVALRDTTNAFTDTNVFTKPVGIDCKRPGQILQIGNPNTYGSQGIIRLASRSTNSIDSRIWDIGVPQTGNETTGIGYGFMIDDTQFGSGPEFLVHWGNGRVGIGRSNPATALDVNGTVTATGFAGNASGLTNLSASQLAGTLSSAQLPSAVVTNNATGLNLSGTFAGNGEGVTNINLMTINSGAAIGWTTNWAFVLDSSPTVGLGPLSVTAADINGDGNVDLISANCYTNTLSVLTNNGSGGFAPASSPGAGSYPAYVIAADVNGDSKVDLISANYDTNTLSVLTNNGSGGFVLASSPTVGLGPLSVAAADVNGDGKVDLISANSGNCCPFEGNTLSALTNNGSGGFVLASSPTVGLGPVWVAAADINGDGKADLISADYLGNTLSVLTNNGSGGFVLASSPAVGSLPRYPQCVVAADVIGDGMLELISANGGDNTLSVLTNNGSGGFALAFSLAVGWGPDSVTAADVNGDGRLDLISANYGQSTLSVLTNNSSGGFILVSSPHVGHQPFSVTAADVNGDGRPDLISANREANNLSVLFNTLSFTADFTGDGSGLTSLNANNFSSGTIADARLSANVALLNANQTFTGANRFAGMVTLTNTGNLLSGIGTFSGNGGGLTNLDATDLTGTVADARLSANVALLNGANVFTGTNRFVGVLQAANVNNQLTGAFTGNGGGLTNLDATDLTGTVADARLSANVALLNGNQVFTGANRFAGVVTLTNAANTIAGNGAGLTNIIPSANYVFSYSTAVQTVLAVGTFQDITCNVNAQMDGWTHTAGSANFTCGQAGLYWIHYKGQVQFREAASAEMVSLRAVVGGVEIAGSDAAVYGKKPAATSADDVVLPVSASFIASFGSGNVLKFQITGASGSGLLPNTGYSTTKPSFSCTIMRLK